MYSKTSNSTKVQEICERLVTYKIAAFSLGIALSIIVLITAICIVSKILHSKNEVLQTNDSSLFWDYCCCYDGTYDVEMSETGVVVLTISAIIGLLAAVALGFEIMHLLQ